MRRLVALLPLVLIGFSMLAHAEVTADAGADVNLPDVVPIDGATTDAAIIDAAIDVIATDASTDAASADAATDGGTTSKDASGQCCPTLPCTCPADGGNATGDAGDNEGAGSGGCSCDSSPIDAGTASPLLLVALAALSRRRKRA